VSQVGRAAMQWTSVFVKASSLSAGLLVLHNFLSGVGFVCTGHVCLHDVEHCVVPVQQLSFVFFQGMPRKKTAGKYRMPQLNFVDSPPLNTPWRPTTPSRSCLCPVTADVVNIDQIGCDWVCMNELLLLLLTFCCSSYYMQQLLSL